MKKIRISIPMLRKEYFEFYIFDLSFRNNTKGQLLLKYVYIFGYAFLLLSFFLVFFSELFYSNLDKDSSVMKFLIMVTPISIGLFLAGVILNGKRRLIDPPFFLAILLFALGITTSSVLVAVPSLGNTFGLAGIRALSGISIIGFISLYYLTSSYIHNRVLFRRVFKIIIVGIFLYLLLVFLSTSAALTTLDNITLIIAAIGGIFVLSKSNDRSRAIKLLMAISLVLIALYSWDTGKLNIASLIYIIIPAIIGLVVLIGTFLISKKSLLKILIQDTKMDLKNLMARKYDLWELARIASVWLILISPVLLVILLLVINTRTGNAFKSLTILMQNNITAFNSLTDFSNGIGHFLFGNGASGLQLANSFIANVILSQGFLGVAAYLFLATYGIIVGIRFVYFSFRKGGNYIIPSFLLFMMTVITIEGLIFYPGLKVIYFWWVCFSLISVKYVLLDKKKFLKFSDEDFKISELKINNRKISRFAKYILVLLIIVVALYITASFNLLIK